MAVPEALNLNQLSGSGILVLLSLLGMASFLLLLVTSNEAFRVGFENERRKAMERAQQAAQARPPVAPTPPRRSSNR